MQFDQEFNAIMEYEITDVYYKVPVPPLNNLSNSENYDNAMQAVNAFKQIWGDFERHLVPRIQKSIHVIRAINVINKTINRIEVSLLKIRINTDFI